MTDVKRRRILVLTPRFPYPVVGGDRLRIYHVCKALSSRFDLTLLSLCDSAEDLETELPEDGVFVRTERVLLPKLDSYAHALGALPSQMPLQVAYYKSAAYEAAVQRLLPDHDCVLSHLIRCAEYVRGSKKPKILEMTDAISLNYKRVRQQKGRWGLRRLVYTVEAERLLKYEREIVNDFDLSVLVSRNDLEYLFGDAGRDDVLVASNGVDVNRYPYKERGKTSPVIAYIGNMHSAQNMDACVYFASEVMPVLRRRLNAVFRVVGRIRERDAAKLRSFSDVEVTGSTEDLPRAVADAWIGVCPVRLAAGVQNKILEYMSLGLPVVTTNIGLQGLSAKPGEELLVADSPTEFAHQIYDLWTQKQLHSMLSLNGRRYVEHRHDWDVMLEPMTQRIEDLLGPR
jgi:glycosyltransferase involved in cell wall biosynthesis